MAKKKKEKTAKHTKKQTKTPPAKKRVKLLKTKKKLPIKAVKAVSIKKEKKQAPSATAKALASAVIRAKYRLDDKVQRLKEVAWRMIDGEAVIITPSDNTMHSLNESGTRIWELINGSKSLREVASVIQTEFDVDQQRAEQDTLWFVECLAKKGLVDKRQQA
jgi:hypothetical protein